MRILFFRARAVAFMIVASAFLLCGGAVFGAGPGVQAKAAASAVSGSAGTAMPAGGKEEQAAEQAASPAGARSTEVTELWTGSLYSSNFRAALCFSAQGAVRGVLLLQLANGKTDVYHIVGKVKNNEIEAWHSSGHAFKGHLVSSDKVEGVISLKNGMKITVDGKRLQDVPVTEDCSPLPQ